MSVPSCSIDPPGSESSFRSAAATVAQDWSELRRYLASRQMHLGHATPRQFAGGLGNLNYLLEVDGTACVLRRPPPGELPAGANDMAREHRILSALAPAFPLAPKAVHFCGDPAVLGAPFLIMEYRPGLVIGGELPPRKDLGPTVRARLAQDLVDLLARLHALDADALGLGELGRPQGMAERTVGGWERRAVAASGDATPAGVGELASWLRARLPEGGTVSLLHNDFKLDNVILDVRSLRPAAVIDWDMGTRGDPLMDLATLLSYWTQADDPPAMHQLRQMPTAAAGFPSRAQVVQAYAQRTGCDTGRFHFYRVLALFRLTVVFMQLHARYLRGEVRDERHRSFGPLASGLLDFARAEAASNEFH